ncbi:MAG TPA: hypothetical protein VGK67_26285 [Myxococcales bacterium]|jgi:ribosomal protein L32
MCEHPQDKGDACDVCGRVLVQAAPVAVPIQALPELERTAIVAGNAVGPPVTMMPELEVHRIGDVQVAAEKMAEMETSAIPGAAAAAAATIEAAPDIERTQLVDAGPRTVVPDTVPCRYCGHPQKRTNVFCEKCANAMPRVILAKVDDPKAKQVQVRCKACGENAIRGEKCPACGYYQRKPDEN